MEQIPCVYCGDFYDSSPRHKNQTSCKKRECQKAKRAAWQRYKMKHDPVYRANQKSSHQKWLKATPGYWENYRKRNPEKALRNRILQVLRNRKARSCLMDVKMNTPPIAKMDPSEFDNFQILGQFWLVPAIAKMDSLKVNIIKVPMGYP
jgi:hypothetical protein